MNYVLMHKNTPTCEIIIDDNSGRILSVKKVFNLAHLPLSSTIHGELILDKHQLNEWWENRAIPVGRSNVGEVLKRLNLSRPTALLTKSLGLSLSDHYWINPSENLQEWSQINFFYNDFSPDLGNIIVFDPGAKTSGLNLFSPDSSTGGNLKKKWIIHKKSRKMLKGVHAPWYPEPVNEVCATSLMKALNIEHVPYTTVKLKKEPFSLCDCFVNTESELIHASEIAVHYSGESRFVDQSLFELMRTACEKEGITGYQDFINRLLTVDYIINNEDRHLNNFGFLRNPETLEWISPAPVYDSGLSLFHNTLTELIDEKEILVAKPFFNDHKRQIGLVTDFTWLDDRKLKSIPDLLHSTLSSYYSRLGLSTNLEVRTDRIAEYARQRIKNLEKTANIQRSPVSRKKPGQALAGSSKGL